MTAWASMGLGQRLALVLGAIGVTAAVGYGVFNLAQAPDMPVGSQASVAAEPSAPSAAAITAPAVTEPATTEVTLPSFDVVRIDAAGNATLAGKAMPGAKLSFKVNDIEVAQSVSDAGGNFAVLFTLAPDPLARWLTLAMITPEGREVFAKNSVAIAPILPILPEQTVAADAVASGAASGAALAPVPETVLVTNDGAVVVGQTTAPQTAEFDLTVSAITYSDSGNVVLSGQGGAAAPLLIYLDQAQITQTSVGLDGNWSVEIADIAPGLYTLRVDQLNAVGEVTARFETPFQRETLETLAAAAQALVAPEAIVAAAAPNESIPAESAATDIAPVTSIDPNNTVAAVIPKDADVAADASNTVGDVAPATPPPPVSVTVQPGFTLWRIAREQLGSGVMYVQVFAANKDNIRDPDLIYPGQVFIIPSKE